MSTTKDTENVGVSSPSLIFYNNHLHGDFNLPHHIYTVTLDYAMLAQLICRDDPWVVHTTTPAQAREPPVPSTPGTTAEGGGDGDGDGDGCDVGNGGAGAGAGAGTGSAGGWAAHEGAYTLTFGASMALDDATMDADGNDDFKTVSEMKLCTTRTKTQQRVPICRMRKIAPACLLALPCLLCLPACLPACSIHLPPPLC